MDNNTFMGTVNTIVYDGVVKNVVGNLARLWPGESNPVTRWAFSDQGGTNHMNDGLWAIGGGFKNWFGAGEEGTAGNGYVLGEAIGTLATIVAGGAGATGGLRVAGRSSILETAGRGILRVRAGLGRVTLAEASALDAQALARTVTTVEASLTATGGALPTVAVDLAPLATGLADAVDAAIAGFEATIPVADVAALRASVGTLRAAATAGDVAAMTTEIGTLRGLATTLNTGLTTMGALPAVAPAATALDTATTAARGITAATDAALPTAATDLATQLEAMITAARTRMAPQMLETAERTVEELRAARVLNARATTPATQTLLFNQLRISTGIAQRLAQQVALANPLTLGQLTLQAGRLEALGGQLGTVAATLPLPELQTIAGTLVQEFRAAAARFAGRDPVLEGFANAAAARVEAVATASVPTVPTAATDLATALTAEAGLATTLTAEVDALRLMSEVGMTADLAQGLRALSTPANIASYATLNLADLRLAGQGVLQTLTNTIQRMESLAAPAGSGVTNAALVAEARQMAQQIGRSLGNTTGAVNSQRVLLADLENAGRLSGRMAEHLEAVALQAERAIPLRQMLSQLAQAERTLGTYSATTALPELQSYANLAAQQLRRAADFFRGATTPPTPANILRATELEAAAGRLEAAAGTGGIAGTAVDSAAMYGTIGAEAAVFTALNVELTTMSTLNVVAAAAPRVLTGDFMLRVGGVGLGVGFIKADEASPREETTPAHTRLPPPPGYTPLVPFRRPPPPTPPPAPLP
jgi:hypothetical protein